MKQINDYNTEKAGIAENLFSYVIPSVCYVVGDELFLNSSHCQDYFVCRSIHDIRKSFRKSKIPFSGMWRRVMCISVSSTAAPIYSAAYILPMFHSTGIFITSLTTSNPIFCLAVSRCWQPWMRVLLRCVVCTTLGSKVRGLCIMEGGDCSNSAEDWVQWQAFVSIQYDECIEYATVSLSICVLPCGISQPVRRLPVICFCINSAALFTLYVFVSTELVKHKANVYNVQDHSNDTSTLTKVLMCHGKQEVDNYWYKHSWSYAACYLHF